MEHFVIAVDGHSSCGKSTLARDLAGKLKVRYIDSGAMYRAVSLYLLENGIDYRDSGVSPPWLDDIRIDFRADPDGSQAILLNGVAVDHKIRTSRVSSVVSEVSAISPVRRFLVRQQRVYREEGPLVMDGRDIGTVVFPDATLKIFLTAETHIRIERRFLEEQAKGLSPLREEVRKNLLKRDRIDSTRSDSPLRMAEDAILVDNSLLDRHQQLDLVYSLFMQKSHSPDAPGKSQRDDTVRNVREN